VDLLSSTYEERRYVASPKAMPPMPVAIMSLYEAGCVSPKNSQMVAPVIAVKVDAQKPSPLERPEL
jgi:hypothetical protein